MHLEVNSLPDDVVSLKEIIFSKSHLIKFQQSRIDHLEERNRLLQAKLFGRKSEKQIIEKEDKQLSLFDEAEVTEEKLPEETVAVPAHTRKKSGRKPLPENLPRVEVIHDLPEAEKVCACGCRLSKIGEEISEKLDIIPAKVQVIRDIRYKYACKHCEGTESDQGAVKTAPVCEQLIPKSIATPGLLSHIIVSKFVDALPLYRQEKIFARIGVEISRGSMANWVIQVADKCEPIVNLLHQEIRSGPLIGIDETTVQVLQEPGRKNTTRSYMWVFRGGDPEKPVLMYEYHPTRSGDVPRTFLNGYKGYVQTDGYKGYDGLSQNKDIHLVGCFAHVRRKFAEVIQARKLSKATSDQKAGSAEVAINYIGKLYAIESQAEKENLSYDALYQRRQEKSKPVLDEFHAWLKKRSNQTPPSGLLGKAMNYTLEQWPKLIRYIEDGRLKPDNNLVENAIRPFVLGRKNWLFSGHPRGADASALLFSLIETAKANKLEPYLYFRYIFDRLPHARTESDYQALLPHHLTMEQLAARLS